MEILELKHTIPYIEIIEDPQKRLFMWVISVLTVLEILPGKIFNTVHLK